MSGTPTTTIPENDAASRPQLRTRVGFAGLVVDLDACILTRATGDPIALTRGELALLREFVRRPGRVLSRDQLLDAVAGRKADKFDRSIDVLVGRLRRKIEPDPKRPSLIVTVPGGGYRFDGVLSDAAPAPLTSPDTTSGPTPRGHWYRGRRGWFMGALCLMLLLGGMARTFWPGRPVPTGPAAVAVLPFANLSGDSSQAYLGQGIASQITTLLGTFPGLRVLSSEGGVAARPLDSAEDAVQAARRLGVQYVIMGGVHRLRDRMRVTAQLYDGTTGAAIWANRFDDAGTDSFAFQEEIANRIYDSLAGLRGRIRGEEERTAWRKASPSLDEYDYYVRGLSLFMRYTLPDVLRARAIWQEGLDRFPGSPLMRVKLAFSYIWPVMSEASPDPRGDIETAWRLARAAAATETRSQLVTWILHWEMAFLYQWHYNDFVHSVTEARAAVDLVPYDALSRGDLSWILANAGHAEEAIAWARTALDHDPNGPDWYRTNLAWAYYVGRRYQEAFETLRDHVSVLPPLFAVICVRLGQVERARAVISDWLKSGATDTIAQEALFPATEPAATNYLDDLRRAGLPEK